jgi:hypothetical protein
MWYSQRSVSLYVFLIGNDIMFRTYWIIIEECHSALV